MNVPFNVTVPVDQALGARQRVEALLAGVQKKLEGMGKRSDPKVAQAASDLVLKSKKITIHNLLRVAISLGLDALEKMPAEALIQKMSDEGVARGRPRDAA